MTKKICSIHVIVNDNKIPQVQNRFVQEKNCGGGDGGGGGDVEECVFFFCE